MRARPLLVTGSELVIATVDHPLIGWASLEEPTEMPDGWRDAVVAGADEPGAIWLGTNETATWKLAHIARMREGETVTFPVGIDLAAQPARAQGVLHAGRDLATVQGQIYEYTSDGWHQVLPGWLAGYTENAALVEQCRTLTSCEQRWFARPQWQLLDAAPDLETAIIEFGVGPVVTEMIGAAESDWAALGSGPDELRALADLDEADYSLCCDQRWLAVRIAERVVLFDTAAGEVWAAYDGLVVEDGGRVLLAQKPG